LHDCDERDGLPGSSLPLQLVGVHIYILELYAAYRCIEKIAALNSGKPALLHLLMDNTAAKSAIQKRYSANKYALEIIKRIHFLCERAYIVLTVSWIASSDNPADEPSRRLKCHDDPVWIQKCLKALGLADGRWSYAYEGGTRHEKLHDVPLALEDPLHGATSSDDDSGSADDADLPQVSHDDGLTKNRYLADRWVRRIKGNATHVDAGATWLR